MKAITIELRFVGVRGAWGDVHGDALPRILERERLGQSKKTGLGRVAGPSAANAVLGETSATNADDDQFRTHLRRGLGSIICA